MLTSLSNCITMKRIITTLNALFLIGLTAGAQTLTFSPAKSVSHQISSDDFEELNISVGLQEAADVTFEWTLIENTLPSSWSYSLCDLGHCYFEIPNTSTMEPLTKAQMENGDQGFFKITIETGAGNYGKGLLRMYVYDKSNMSQGDTVTFDLEYAEPNNVSNASANGLKIYPNPNNGNFTITHSFDQALNYELINSCGERVYQGSDADVHLAGLSKGVYFLRLSMADGRFITEKVVIR